MPVPLATKPAHRTCPDAIRRDSEGYRLTNSGRKWLRGLSAKLGGALVLHWHSASCLLAYCDMRTLYLRNVPDDVVARLERLAARDATSVGAVAVRELAEVSRRADNPALLGSLPDLGVNVATILHDLDAGRADR